MQLLYSLFVFLLKFAMTLGALVNEKLRKGVKGRKESLAYLKEVSLMDKELIWMHAASLGEYEQGLPVLEKLREQLPNHEFLVSFFSPSGYEQVQKKKEVFHHTIYLPFDTKKEVSSLLNLINPSLFFTVKYDYWHHLLQALNKKGVPAYVVSALFYKDQIYFSFWGKRLVKWLEKEIDWIFHQTQESFELAQSVGLKRGSVSGDTRMDRVKVNAQKLVEIAYIEEFKSGLPTVIYGSSWQDEEEIALEINQRNLEVKQIIAPHDLKRVEEIKKKFPGALLYSGIPSSSPDAIKEAGVLIIDSIGLLSRLYRYGDIAVVGGGFHSKGLHNILEASVFGLPVLFGAKYRKNPEAEELIKRKGASKFFRTSELVDYLQNLIKNPKERNGMGAKSREFVYSQNESAVLIVEKMKQDLHRSPRTQQS